MNYGIPPFVPNGDGYITAYGAQGSAGAEASKARVSLQLAVNAVSYVYLCLASEGFQSCCPNTEATSQADCGAQQPGGSPPHFVPIPTVSVAGQPFFYLWIEPSGPLWVSSPAGLPKRFGSFPSVRISALAFGSVPVTATVHIEQVTGRDGYIDPIQISGLVGGSSSPNDAYDVSALGRYPAYHYPAAGSVNNNFYLTEPYFFDGKVNIRISDVRVDQVPVDVGPSCQTERPGTLALTAPGGQYDNSAGAPKLRGRAGEFQPLSVDPGSIQGNVEIPTFSGCHDGAEDLDPLLTAIASSPTNPVEVTLAKFGDCQAVGCPPYPIAPTPTTSAQRKAVPAASVPARTLTEVRQVLARMSPDTRARALASMAPGVRRAVTGS